MTESRQDQSKPFETGYVQVYTGDGKGKTTAAIGLALRALGAGLHVLVAQFIKSQPYGEIRMLERFGDFIDCRQYGSGCWLRGEPSREDIARAQAGLNDVRQAIRWGDFDLVVLDEINVATWFGLIEVDDLLDLIDHKPQRVELIFTGRRADQKLIEKADLVTEMRDIKHYYQNGVLARPGIES